MQIKLEDQCTTDVLLQVQEDGFCSPCPYILSAEFFLSKKKKSSVWCWYAHSEYSRHDRFTRCTTNTKKRKHENEECYENVHKSVVCSRCVWQERQNQHVQFSSLIGILKNRITVSSTSFQQMAPRKKPLVGVIAFVETLNEDGTDASTANANILRALGATIAESFGENCTHLVWSNASERRLAAAGIFGIPIVSPLWIENCNESGTKVDESDFAVTTGHKAGGQGSGVGVGVGRPAASVPVPNAVKSSRRLNSPFYSSSQRLLESKAQERSPKHQSKSAAAAAEIAGVGGNNKSMAATKRGGGGAKAAASLKAPAVSSNQHKASSSSSSSSSSRGGSSSSSSSRHDAVAGDEDEQELPPFIPLPRFKEHNPIVLPTGDPNSV